MLDFLLKTRIKKLCKKQNTGQKIFRNFNEIRSVLVVFETKNFQEANTFMEGLKHSGKKITGCAYRTKEDKNTYSKTFCHIITPKEDTDWMGGVKSDLVDSLNMESYQVLIDLTIEENRTLEYLVASVRTPLKVGYKKSELSLYDLSITSLPDTKKKNQSNVKELCKQISYYLNTIHSSS